MKKLITFCFFLVSFLFVSNNAFAQDKVAINKTAFENAEKLATKVKLNEERLEFAYQAFKNYGQFIADSTDDNNNIHPLRVEVIEKKLQKEMLTFLTTDEFEIFLELFNKQALLDYKEN